MATLGPLVPTSQASAGNWTTQSGGMTDLHLTVDEGLTSPNDADYVQGEPSHNGSLTTRVVLGIGPMPSDFDSMESVSVRLRYRQSGWSDDTIRFSTVSIVNEFNEFLADSTFNPVGDVTNSAFQTSGIIAMPLTFAGEIATKADWDNARVSFGQLYTTSMSNDGARIQVSVVEISGTYIASGPPIRDRQWVGSAAERIWLGNADNGGVLTGKPMV